MHRIIINLFLIVALASCSSSRNQQNVLNDYVKAEFATKYDTIFIAAEKTPPAFVISVYERAYRHRNENGNKPVHAYPEPPNWPLNEIDIEQLKSSINNMQPASWKEKDFAFAVSIIPKDYFKHKLIHDNNNRVLYLSDPIYNSKKDVALFAYAVARPGMLRNTYERLVLVMVKRNGKWNKCFSLWEEIYD